MLCKWIIINKYKYLRNVYCKLNTYFLKKKRKVNFSYCFWICEDWRKERYCTLGVMILSPPKRPVALQSRTQLFSPASFSNTNLTFQIRAFLGRLLIMGINRS